MTNFSLSILLLEIGKRLLASELPILVVGFMDIHHTRL